MMLGFIPPALKRTLSEFNMRRTDYLRKNLGRYPRDPTLLSLGNGPHASCLLRFLRKSTVRPPAGLLHPEGPQRPSFPCCSATKQCRSAQIAGRPGQTQLPAAFLSVGQAL